VGSTSNHEINLGFIETLFTQPEGNFAHYFLCLCFDCKHPMRPRCGIFHSRHHVSTHKALDFGALLDFRLGMLNLYAQTDFFFPGEEGFNS
jgi:hypothetical protein